MPTKKSSLKNAQASFPTFATLSGQVYKVLRNEIVTGNLTMGTRLVRRDIAKRLKVSTIPVIEALHRLERDGLAESSPMFGFRVVVWDMDSLRSDEMLREAIECQNARLCALSANETQINELTKLAETVDELTMKSGGVSPEPHSHYHLHLRIAEMTGCKSLIEEFKKVWRRRQMRFSIETGEKQKIPHDRHALLIKSIASKNPDLAESEMRKHVQFGTNRDKVFLQKVNSPDFHPPSWLSDI